MPTIKQKKAFIEVVENGRSISAAMREAGYSPETAVVPGKLTQSKGWQELMQTYLPDEVLAQKHRELLDHTGPDGALDVQAVKAGLDMAYKLKGSYAPEKNETLVAHLHLTGAVELKQAAQSLANQIADGYRLGKPDGRTDSGDGRGGHPDMAESLPDSE